MMSLGHLIEGLGVAAPAGLDLQAVSISGVAHDSRRVRGGDLFVTWRGERFDGASYVDQAIARGASAVLVDRSSELVGEGSAEQANETLVIRSRDQRQPVPCLTAPDPHRLLAPLAARLYDHPDRALRMVGVTGTNGKTSVVRLVADLLTATGSATGSLGTLGSWLGARNYDDAGNPLEGSSQPSVASAGRTTPEASDLFRRLAGMRRDGAVGAAMEVSSHALSLGRVAELRFDVAVFTQLGRDHLDFHRDMESYFEAKASLFAQLKPGGAAIVGISDSYGRRLAKRIEARYTYGQGGDFDLIEVSATARGIEGRAKTPDGAMVLRSPLVGRFHADNLLAAIAVATALGVEPGAIEEALPRLGTVPGRMEPVAAGQGFPVFVDYAHTEEALRSALDSLREVWPGRVLVVFGCGGERDLGKRPRMGRVAGEHADFSIVTDDNPRSEDPAAIHRAIVEGLDAVSGKQAVAYEVVPDRYEAIARGLERAHAGGDWAVLIAGKGHEETQSIGGRELVFSDRQAATKRLGELLGSQKAR